MNVDDIAQRPIDVMGKLGRTISLIEWRYLGDLPGKRQGSDKLNSDRLDGKHCIYVIWGDDQHPLYVGNTPRGWRRIAQHRNGTGQRELGELIAFNPSESKHWPVFFYEVLGAENVQATEQTIEELLGAWINTKSWSSGYRGTPDQRPDYIRRLERAQETQRRERQEYLIREIEVREWCPDI